MEKRFLLILIIFLLIGQSKGQEINAVYRNYFGNQLILKADSSFNYLWRFDLYSSWSNGKWINLNDTIYLRTIPIYDTLAIIEGSIRKDTLVLSDDLVSGKVNYYEYLGGLLSSGGQNRNEAPEKLFFKRNRLYQIGNNGKIVKKRCRGMYKKKFPIYYRIVNE